MSTSTLVTIDRVIAAMQGHGISLVDDPSGRTAHANINGFEVMFVILDSVMIVRTAAATQVPSDTPDPTLYLAANQVNSSLIGARAMVVNRQAEILLRTEAEVPIAAGLTDEQLSSSLKRAVDGILNAQDALKVTAEQFEQMRDSAEQAGGSADL
ncbi:Putative sensory transduction regulator [Corynebacterium mycetoides]|uniref:Putative sensory transduction regulator n=1 Tax=Corynebacterium mycetoides TaxID=38302 RepID=A0A1G9MKS0_9CORY|nr:YbjN domain-containing protein [Corynebacterium mycetoides]SDL74866.1 Putative sensory transduction regulator [Corynebacterium mycetoides]